LKLAEAMAAQVPVAVADIAPLTEMVTHGETGRVFAQGADALAEALEAVRLDPAAAQAMARAARAWVVANRTWDAVSRRLLSAWRD
ncbi:MAG TPA: glycosyltransferase, partial [Magnetospirillum sp.]|nr:glycosyltransferase [Magnetospirillum sp.]